MRPMVLYGLPREALWMLALALGLLALAAAALLAARARVRRLEAESAALRRAEQKLRLAMDATQDGIWEWYPQTGAVVWSPEAYTMLGYAPDAFPMSLDRWRALLHPEDAPGIMQEIMAQIDAEPDAFAVEFRLQHRDGSWVWIYGRGRVAEVDAEGALVRVIGTHTDITARKEMETALRQSENLLQRVFDLLPIGLWIADAEGRLIRNNPAGRRIWGAEPRVGQDEYRVFRARRMPSGEPVAPDDWALNHTINEGVTVVDEMLEIDAFDGERRVILNYTAPVVDESGNVEAAIIINQDITARQRATAALRTLNAELEQRVAARTAELEAANQELEAFAYAVSHDLRAPLRALDGFSAALLTHHTDQLDDQGQHYLDRIQAASQRMGMLIHDLLNLSRVTRHTMARERVDLSALAWDVVAELREGDPERAVDVRVGEGMIVEGDAHLLRIALQNLLDNAWKFTGHAPRPRIEVGTVTQAGERVFFVRDNGVGFDMAYADKLFKPFQRLHAMDAFPGTGIGLVTVRRIVTRHGGRIWVTAAEDDGATFSFTLGGSR